MAMELDDLAKRLRAGGYDAGGSLLADLVRSLCGLRLVPERLPEPPAPPVARRDRSGGHGLTPREVEVLRLLVEGRSDREIATALFVSRHTAANHVGSILGKLGVTSRAAAAAWAVRQGLA
jgi:DNA-binding CsgD family transcriptional regulator